VDRAAPHPDAGPIGSSESSTPSVERDGFDKTLTPHQVEHLGNLNGSIHLSRLLEHWSRTGTPRDSAVEQAAALLMGFRQREVARAVFRELERAPIGNVYPLQIQMRIMETAPDFFPHVTIRSAIENKDALQRGARILAGHDVHVHVPRNMKLKAFALLSDGKPGYAFEPLRTGVFRLVVDTPGQWTFAVRGEVNNEQVLDTFVVGVRAAA
jgi:hypothetical protein